MTPSRGVTSLASSFLADLTCFRHRCFQLPAKLAYDIEAGAGSFDGELALRLSQAGHDVEEQAP